MSDKCNTCLGVLGDEDCSYPTQKNMYFLGNKNKNQICCENSQLEVEEEFFY